MRSRAVDLGVAVAALALLAVTALGLLIGGPAGTDRADELAQRLRCPVCTSVSIAESQSDTAVAMRQAVAEQIDAGRSDAEIIDYFRARYGDWVLIDPPARGRTMLVWVLPAVAALVGFAVVLARTRRTALPVAELAVDPAPAVLEQVDQPAPDPGHDRSRRARVAAYALTALAALVAAGVLLPRSVGERPAGGFVTGNEIGRPGPGPLIRDPAAVSDAELEAAVAANPGVVGMRLALAERYLAQGDYDRAGQHYSEALRREPGNPEAQAHFGWLLLQLGRPVEALEWVDRALAAPERPPLDALWFRANIALHGLDDPAAALDALERMRDRDDLSPTVAQQVDELAALARQRQSGPEQRR